MDINQLVNLCSKAWALPLLAAMSRGMDGRQALLVRETGAGRTAFRQSLDHCIDLDLIERNPGHGHPLRPEFRLTADGSRWAALANGIVSTAGKDGQEILRLTWPVPVLAALPDHNRFRQLKSALPGITDRALSQALVRLETAAWVEREVLPDVRPPVALYKPVSVGADISAILRDFGFRGEDAALAQSPATKKAHSPSGVMPTRKKL